MYREWYDSIRRHAERTNSMAKAVDVRPRHLLEQPTFPMGGAHYAGGYPLWYYRKQLAGLKYHWGVRTAFDRWMEDWR